MMNQQYRGGIIIDYSRCNGCGKCYEICPTDIFSYDSKTKLLTVEYPEECWYCGACLFDCPCEGAIHMELPLACL